MNDVLFGVSQDSGVVIDPLPLIKRLWNLDTASGA
jgi:hypothetical protein